MFKIFRTLFIGVLLLPFVSGSGLSAAAPARRIDKPKPAQAVEYVAKPRPGDGRHLALSVAKLEKGFAPPRPFLIWALGSSYTAKLGDGTELIGLLRDRFGKEREIVYKRQVGNSVPWQYLRGWARHLVIPDQPDLVLIYTIGKRADLEKLIVELRRFTTADIIVPSIHWRERDQPLWGKFEDAADQKVDEVRQICRKHGVEFVENRKEWGEYLAANNLKIEDLLNDPVHQSGYGARMVNQNIARHLHRPERFGYVAESRERSIGLNDERVRRSDGGFELEFSGSRVDLIGRRAKDGGSLKVFIDGIPAGEANAFAMTYIQYAKANFQEARSPARDQSPHGVTLGKKVVPQDWTIRMLDGEGKFELIGSITGADGQGSAFKPFTSDSGQIILDPNEWRRAERNRKDDRWTWSVKRVVAEQVNFAGAEGECFRVTLAAHLSNGRHRLRLVPTGKVDVERFDVFEPPLR